MCMRGGVFMFFDDIKKYRKDNLFDESGWDYIDNEIQSNLNIKVIDFCNASRCNEELLKEIKNIFSCCRYSFTLRIKELSNYFVFKTLEYNVKEKVEFLDVLTGYVFDCFNEFIIKTFNPLKTNKKGVKNDNFTLYFSMYAPKIVKEKMRLEFGDIYIPPYKYRNISKLLKIRNDYYSKYHKYPDYKLMTELFNTSMSDKKKHIDENEVKCLMFMVGELNPISIDDNGENDEGESIPFEISDPVNPYHQTYMDRNEYKMFNDLADTFSAMLNYEEFLNHYNNDIKKTSQERYECFRMFYTCDTIKYLKELPQLQYFLFSRNNKIINGCDENFFKYILICNQASKIVDLGEIMSLEFKTFEELEANVFSDKDLDIKIFVYEQSTGKKTGLLKLKNEGLIYTSYNLYKKGYVGRIKDCLKNNEKSSVKQKNTDYKKYQYAFLHRILEMDEREEYG